MFERIFVGQWMSLPREIRLELRRLFDIPQSNVVEVRDNTVITDGVTNDDLQVITLEKLKQVTKNNGTFAELFEKAVKMAKPPVYISINGIQIMKKEFCDSCDSKGVRHKKSCPKNTI